MRIHVNRIAGGDCHHRHPGGKTGEELKAENK